MVCEGRAVVCEHTLLHGRGGNDQVQVTCPCPQGRDRDILRAVGCGGLPPAGRQVSVVQGEEWHAYCGADLVLLALPVPADAVHVGMVLSNEVAQHDLVRLAGVAGLNTQVVVGIGGGADVELARPHVLHSQQNEAQLIVATLGSLVKCHALKDQRELGEVHLAGDALPVQALPALGGIRHGFAGVEQVANESGEARAEAALGQQAQLQLAEADHCVLARVGDVIHLSPAAGQQHLDDNRDAWHSVLD